jgi:FkbM family methyltransferase
MPIRGFGSVRVRTDSTDEFVFLQVFSHRQYDLSRFAQETRISAEYNNILSNGGLPVIVDAGANVGAAAIWFATKYPKGRIVAVEPDPTNAAMCRLNTQRFPMVKVVEAAIGSRPGLVSLANPFAAACAVQTIRSDAEKGVRVRTIPELVAAEGPSAQLFIVKVDIEGFEDDLFETNLGWIDETAAIIIEPHDWMLPGKGTSVNFRRALAERGFELLISGENLVYVRRGSVPESGPILEHPMESIVIAP